MAWVVKIVGKSRVGDSVNLTVNFQEPTLGIDFSKNYSFSKEQSDTLQLDNLKAFLQAELDKVKALLTNEASLDSALNVDLGLS